MTFALLAVTLSVPAAYAQAASPPTSSAPNLPSSGTDANRTRSALASCNAVADELRASRILTDTLERENALLKERIETEKRAVAQLAELNETRKSETQALQKAIEAKNETIAAKDAVIAAQDQLVSDLKRKRSSIWRRIGDIVVGAAIGAVLR